MSDAQPLHNKIVLITGGAVRVGAAITRRLHRAGATVVFSVRQSRSAGEALLAELNAQRANSAYLLQADLHDMAQVTALVDQTLARCGRLDILINNASTYYPTPVGEITEAHWQDLMGTNAKAPLFLSQAATPALRASHGCIINLVDIHADRPNANHPVYGMAKAANAMLVKSLARDLAPEVRVNGVAPGAVLWPEDYLADDAKQAILTRIPMGRPGTPEDIAETVLFLATGSGYLTGQIIAVDGGRSVQQ